MLWILVGIVIISVFTAGLTTALSSEDSGKKIISGKIVSIRITVNVYNPCLWFTMIYRFLCFDLILRETFS